MSFKDLDIEGNSDYLKLTAGVPVTFHILSRVPKKQSVHWIDKKKNVCIGKGCEHCLNADKPKQRWSSDVYDRKDSKVKKLEFGPQIAGQFKAIAEMMAENQQTIHQTDIRIKTTGSSLETEYSVLPIPMMGAIPTEILSQYRTDEEIPF